MISKQHSIEISRNMGVEGFYRLQRIKASTGEVVQDTGVFPNLITSNGLTRWLTADPFDCFYVGTGSRPPAEADTQLVAYRAASGFSLGYSTQNSGFPHPTPWVQSTLSVDFGTGVAAGNLTEIGVGWAEGGGTPSAANHRVFSRALILDAAGQPTTLTVLPDEILRVTYQLRMYIPFNVPDEVKVMKIGNVDTTVTIRNANGFADTGFELSGTTGALWRAATDNWSFRIQQNGTALGPVTGRPTGGTTVTVTANWTYDAPTRVANTVTRPASLRFALDQGNVPGGIGYCYFTFRQNPSPLNQGIQIKFDPPILKTASQILTLTFSDTVTINSKG